MPLCIVENVVLTFHFKIQSNSVGRARLQSKMSYFTERSAEPSHSLTPCGALCVCVCGCVCGLLRDKKTIIKHINIPARSSKQPAPTTGLSYDCYEFRMQLSLERICHHLSHSHLTRPDQTSLKARVYLGCFN